MRRTLYDDDHEAFRASVRTFVDKEIAPHVDEWSAAGITPRELFTAAGKQGFLGMDVPEEYGGGGVPDFRFNAVLGEELLRTPDAAAPGSASPCTTTSACPTSSSYCTEEQKQRWLPGIASGELITAIGMTEPGIGSDLASMRHHRPPRRRPLRRQRRQDLHHQRDQRRPGHHRGARPTPTAAPPRHVAARSSSAAWPGFTRGRNLDKLGQHAQDTAELFFDRRARAGREPARAEEGQRLRPARREPAAGAAVDRDRARWRRSASALELTLAYVKERQGVRAAGRDVPELAGSSSPRSRPSSTSPSTTSTTASARSTTAS